MRTNDLNSKLTADTLNESMFKKFGTKIKFENYSREDLENYRNLLRTKLHQAEGSASFNDLLTNETYQKDKYMVGVLNTRIKEMLGEGAKVDRQAKHITNSMMKKGKSKDEAEGIAWAHIKHPKKKKTKAEEGIEDTTMNNKKVKESFPTVAGARKDAQGTTGMKTGEKKKSSTGGTITKTKGGLTHSAGKNYGGAGSAKAPDSDKRVKESFPTVAKARKDAEGTAGMKTGEKKKSSTGGVITKTATGVKHAAGKNYGGAGSAKAPDSDKRVKEGLKGNQGKLDADNDGKLEKSDFAKLRAKKKVKESQATFRRHVRLVNEGLTNLLMEDEEGKAKAITAASDMVNDFTTWMQRVGQYQTKSMIELADSIRAEFGQEEAEAFKAAVAPALAATLEVMTAERESISHAVAVLAGEASDIEQMGSTGGVPDMSGGADEFGGEEIPGGGMDSMNADGFDAADAASGGMETAGREQRMESRKLAVQRKLQESHSLMRTLSK